MPETFIEGVVKVHLGCGGIVRAVEDLNTRAVEYGYECLHCQSDGIVREDLLFLYADEFGDLDRQDLINAPRQRLEKIQWDKDWNGYEDAVKDGFLEKVERRLTGSGAAGGAP